ncbi:hypothetical protein GLOIN_2v1781371 [Rhizophagus irregularis DAOM 181602=DAOM 197198]|uniref:DUF8211 domain-containing protein n=1 Tax=Rhizophagus irregularis (strain DAOM 181602 / DAOM 197198 / MUCL 43194) TaxID=747089 RepID=A0A2P4PJZ4_RHIID|nr:hypothetical protein GLOIN_2v1781371 [Rhizophagus irregularis DAOM 181602=DAOM 197198]POG65719.1 hypothetical protein GLOIN_2v1781371 [Rhizophagus irregularis DAOM 181602=DAOM 197198]|eukprot:XP_025172585.1 hypothetical protein GLOIN_2v1781371 [Rhizophagus irregularis DAOM 181602=DAOM 197198]
MYSKRIENLRPFPSKNPKTALKQQERFQRACRRIFTTKTISTSTSSSSKEVKKALQAQADILTKENLIVTGTPAFLQKPIQLRQAHDKAGWKTPSNKKTYYVAPPPSSTIKNTSVSVNSDHT